jgi:F420H(2)-dependent quinone reductase
VVQPRDRQQVRDGDRRVHSETLTVTKRASKQPQKIPVTPVEVDGVKYLVSTRGESQWVKNVRVDPNVTLTTKSGTTKYVANETPVENRQPIFDAYKLNAGKIVEVWPRCVGSGAQPSCRAP